MYIYLYIYLCLYLSLCLSLSLSLYIYIYTGSPAVIRFYYALKPSKTSSDMCVLPYFPYCGVGGRRRHPQTLLFCCSTSSERGC